MSYVLAVHVPIAGMALVPILFDMPLLFFPVHIMFLEIIIDPSSTLIFEAEPSDPNIMKRPPRKLNSSLVNYSDIAWNSLTGLISFCLVFAIYWFLLKRGDSPELARTVTYLALVYCNLILIIYWLPAGRLKGMVKGLMKNKALLGVLGVIGLFSLFVLFVPGFQKIFHFGGIAWFHGGLLLLLAVLMTFFILVVERLRLAFVN
jgi:Ca2+-transporting ATPase